MDPSNFSLEIARIDPRDLNRPGQGRGEPRIIDLSQATKRF